MDEVFIINESLKDQLVQNFGITYAKTTFHKNGSVYLSDPFYETEARWPDYQAFKNLKWEEAEDLGEVLYKAKNEIEKVGGQMTQPIFEILNNTPQLVWAVFLKS